MKTTILDKTPLTPGCCEWCGNLCELEDVACCLSCEAQLNRLEAAQGRIVLRVLKRWRKHRGMRGTPGEGAMTEVAAITDRFLKLDRIRREKLQAAKRANATGEVKIKIAAPGGQAPVQTAAPLIDRQEEPPEGATEDWRSKGTKTEEGYNG